MNVDNIITAYITDIFMPFIVGDTSNIISAYYFAITISTSL